MSHITNNNTNNNTNDEESPPLQFQKLKLKRHSTIPRAAGISPPHTTTTPIRITHSPTSESSESSPLLSQKPTTTPLDITQDELTQMARLTLPTIATFLLEMLPGPIGLLLVGHIPSDHTHDTVTYMDAAAVSIIFINMVAISTGFGLASAMDTLCSQAYGAGEGMRMGTYLQTGVGVLGGLYLGILWVGCYTTEVLLFLGQPKVVSELAGTFTLYLLPGVPFLYLYELLKRLLQAQNIASPMLIVALIGNIINITVGYYLVHYTSMGYLGVAAARSLCNITLAVLLVIYVIISGRITAFWDGIQWRKAVQGVGTFVTLGFAGMLQLCFEWWAFEIMGIICGWLPEAVVSIGANAVMMQISSMVYMLYYAISVSGNVRIGNALGANSTTRAEIAAKLTLGSSILVSLTVAIFLLLFRTRLPRLFTTDPTICKLTSDLLTIAAAFQLGDAVNSGVQGVLRASGRQDLGAKLNFVAFYVLGIPLGAWFALGPLGWGVVGLWVGMSISVYSIAILGSVVVLRSDWKALAEEARCRTKE